MSEWKGWEVLLLNGGYTVLSFKDFQMLRLLLHEQLARGVFEFIIRLLWD